MIDHNDSSMKEIISAFCEESQGLLQELQQILEKLEDDNTQSALFEKYGQIVDRIMGAADSMGFTSIGSIAKMGKLIGYKASQTGAAALRELAISILFDANDTLLKMIDNLEKGRSPTDSISLTSLSERLKWLADKFKDIKRASVGFEE